MAHFWWLENLTSWIAFNVWLVYIYMLILNRTRIVMTEPYYDKLDLHETVRHAEAVIFDLFHTLTSVESSQAPGRLTCDILQVDREEWLDQLLLFSHERLTGEWEDPFLIISKLARALNPSISEALIREAANERLGRFKHALRFVPQKNIAVIRELRSQGKKVALCSNADKAEIVGWPESPLNGLFDTAVFSCEVGCVKPERAIYAKVCADLDIKPEACIFVGDGGSHELRGAREMNMTTVMTIEIIRGLWADRIELNKADADFVIVDLTALLW